MFSGVRDSNINAYLTLIKRKLLAYQKGRVAIKDKTQHNTPNNLFGPEFRDILSPPHTLSSSITGTNRRPRYLSIRGKIIIAECE